MIASRLRRPFVSPRSSLRFCDKISNKTREKREKKSPERKNRPMKKMTKEEEDDDEDEEGGREGKFSVFLSTLRDDTGQRRTCALS